MLILAGLAITTLIAVSVFVAVRLLLMHLRTGAAPELLLGIMLLLSVGIGYASGIAANRTSPELAAGFQAISDAAIGVGFVPLFVFTWRVFRPETVWAAALAIAGSICLLVVAAHGCVQVLYLRGMVDVLEIPAFENLMRVAPIGVAYAWTAWESLRYYGAMQRRAKLGIADPVVSNRFLLWGLMGLSALIGVLLNGIGILLNVSVHSSPAMLLISSLTGGVQTVCLVLAFVPPRAYLERIRSAAPAPAA